MERILVAAVWFDDGKEYPHQPKNISTGIVLCGFRHSSIFSQIGGTVGERKNLYNIATRKQGFLTNLNRFVDRKEAAQIAFAAGQIKNPIDTLISEDLY